MFKVKVFCSVIAVAAFFAVVPAAHAKVFSIPAEDTLATISIPDAWEPNETDNGIEMNSPDRGIYVDAEAVKADNITDAVAGTVKLLASQGLVIDESSKKISDSEMNGLKIHDLEYTGKDNDGPTNFSISLIETSVPDKFVMLTFWGSDEAVKTNGKVLGDIAHSVQLTKR